MLITWPSVTGASSYTVYYDSNPSNLTQIRLPLETNKVTGVTGTSVYLTTIGATIGATSGSVNPGSIAFVNGTTYYFVVVASNVSGSSAPSSSSSAVPSALGTTTPIWVSAGGADSSITVSWNASSDGLGSTYNIYYGTTASGALLTSSGSVVTSGTGALLTPLTSVNKITGITSTSVTLKTQGASIVSTDASSGAVNGYPKSGSISLSNGTRYFFVVTSVTAASTGVPGVERGPSSVVSAVPSQAATSMPYSLSAVPGDNKVTLSWGTPSTGASYYNVYYSTTSGGAATSSPYRITGITSNSVVLTTYFGSSVTITASSGNVALGSIGLIDGTTYYFVVTAVSGGAESYPTLPTAATPTTTLSSVPSNVTASAGNQSVTLSWTPPLDGKTSYYNVYYATTSAGATTASTYNITHINYDSVTFTTTGSTISSVDNFTGGLSDGTVNAGSVSLANGTNYYFVVTSVAGSTERTASSPVTISAPEPATIATNLSATAGQSQVTLAWTPPADGLASTYNIYYSTVSGGATSGSTNKVTGISATGAVLAASGATITSALIGGGSNGNVNAGSITLSNGTTYYFVVSSVTSGAVERGVTAYAQATPVLTPTIPSGLVATGGNSLVQLSWTAPSDGQTATYNVYYSTTLAGATTSSPYKVTGITSSAVTFTTAGGTITSTDTSGGATNGVVGAGSIAMVNGTTYYFIVTSVTSNGYERGASTSASAAPALVPTPLGPAGLTAVAGNTQVGLNWSSTSNASTYNVYYSNASSVSTSSWIGKVTGLTVITTTLTTSGATITSSGAGGTVSSGSSSLVNGTPYWFVVTGVNSIGVEGPPSSPAQSATPNNAPSTQPTFLSATPKADNEISLSWTAPTAGADTYNVYYSTTFAGASTGSMMYLTGITGTSVNLYNPLSNSGVTWSASGTQIASSSTGAVVSASATTFTAGTMYYFVVTGVKTGVEGPISSPPASANPYSNNAALCFPSMPTGTLYIAPDWSYTGGASGTPNLQASVPSNGSVTLTWNAATLYASVAEYNIYYSTTAAGANTTSATNTTCMNSTSTTISGLTHGTTYYFLISTVGYGGENYGKSSGSLSITP